MIYFQIFTTFRYKSLKNSEKNKTMIPATNELSSTSFVKKYFSA